MGLLERGQAALIARQKLAGATAATILYQREAGGAPVNLTGKAWRGLTVFRRNPLEGGAPVVFGDRDYLIPVMDLAIGGVPFEPVRGDRITETLGTVTTVFEVLPPFGEPEARYSDPGRTLWRVHVQEVSA